MQLLTVRLDDESYRALKDMAAGTTMKALVEGWIAAGATPQPTTQQAVAVRDGFTMRPELVHQQCEATEARLEAELKAAKDKYDPMLGVLMNVYAACAKQGDVRQYMIWSDVVTRVREIVDAEAPF